MYVIGIDPHKGSHTAAVLDAGEELLGELRVVAGEGQRDQLLAFAERFTPRLWAIESASGWGALLAQQLVAAGEAVVDVPPKLSARARLLDADNNDKTDRHDARSVATVALRRRGLRAVGATDYTMVLRLLADRHHDLVAARTRTVCRLHALLCLLIAGGKPRRLNEATARAALENVRPTSLVDIERKAIAIDLVADIRRLDDQLARLKARITRAVETVGTTVTDLYGVGPIVAAIILGQTGDIARFRTAGHYAATTPPPRSRPPQATTYGTGSTHSGTDNSTTPSTSPRSPRSATTPPAAPTTSASKARARPAKKPSAPSNAASATPSTGTSSPTPAGHSGVREDTQGRHESSVTGLTP